MDVTESVLQAREADARLHVAHHAANLASWEYEPETDIWRRSHAVDELFGFAPGEGGPVAAPFFARMHPDDFPRVSELVGSFIESPDETVVNYEYRIVLPGGGIRYIASRGEVLRTSTGKVRLIGVMMDVTEDRAREAALANSVKAQSELLEQKDALLAEVNHRVKNSLQLVVSTLRLQARRIHDTAATAEAFNQAISRVRAIISVHERLYRDQNSLTMEIADHLRKLCLDLTGDSASSHIVVEVEPLELPTEHAIPISVIVNEVLMAAIEDTISRNGGIVVSLTADDDQELELSIVGDGASSGLSELGTRLVTSMAAQIEGHLSEERYDGGYRVNVLFPKAVS